MNRGIEEMSISRTEVVKIAELAKLEFSEEEMDALTARFQRILDYVEALKEVNVEGVEPTSHAASGAGAAVPALRDDVIHRSLPAADALGNAPDPGSDHFRVPKVI